MSAASCFKNKVLIILITPDGMEFPLRMAHLMPKICDMKGVREYMEGDLVELWRDDDTGRLVIRARNECGNNSTTVDLFDILDWMSVGPNKRVLESAAGGRDESDRSAPSRNREGN